MTWAQRLKRVFNIDIAICEECDGAVNVIDSIEVLVKRINDRSGHEVAVDTKILNGCFRETAIDDYR